MRDKTPRLASVRTCYLVGSILGTLGAACIAFALDRAVAIPSVSNIAAAVPALGAGLVNVHVARKFIKSAVERSSTQSANGG